VYEKLKKPVFGVGINDSPDLTKKRIIYRDAEGKKKEKIVWECPYYRTWHDMLRRSYSPIFKKKFPTYKDVTCCEDWLLYSNFKKFMVENYGVESKLTTKKKVLDKDLLFKRNKIYSPETCVFVIPQLNAFILGDDKGSKYLVGASRHIKDIAKGNNAPFIGRCSDPFNLNPRGNRTEYCKVFPTEIEAHDFWRQHKHAIALKYAESPCTPEKLRGLLRTRWAILKTDGVYT
jgi:hypothetical protein|tara:strand:+ start:356 stop:1051 length:696 start_codon:yes stop_codon:yes gene_type:complete